MQSLSRRSEIESPYPGGGLGDFEVALGIYDERHESAAAAFS